jgi:hypothetical protein
MRIPASDAMDMAPIQTNDKINILCMGMVFATAEYAKKQSRLAPRDQGQAYRDRLRCLKIQEIFNAIVYTADAKHGESFDVERGRHYCGNFAHRKFLIEFMDKMPIIGKISIVIFDPFFTPPGYIQTRWDKNLFKQIIPGFNLIFKWLV